MTNLYPSKNKTVISPIEVDAWEIGGKGVRLGGMQIAEVDVSNPIYLPSTRRPNAGRVLSTTHPELEIGDLIVYEKTAGHWLKWSDGTVVVVLDNDTIVAYYR